MLQTEGTAIVKALKAGGGGGGAAKGVFEEQWEDPWDCSRVSDGERERRGVRLGFSNCTWQRPGDPRTSVHIGPVGSGRGLGLLSERGGASWKGWYLGQRSDVQGSC